MTATAGTSTTADALNARLCALAQSRAAQVWDTIAFAAYIDGQDIAGLEQAGFDTATATSFKAAADYLRQDAQVFLGQASVSPSYNFSQPLAPYVGPDPQAT